MPVSRYVTSFPQPQSQYIAKDDLRIIVGIVSEMSMAEKTTEIMRSSQESFKASLKAASLQFGVTYTAKAEA